MHYICFMSRKPSGPNGLHAHSLPEIKNGIEDVRIVLERESRRRDGGAVAFTAVLNAVVVQFLKLPFSDKVRIAREGLVEFERLLQSDVEIPFAGETSVAGGVKHAMAADRRDRPPDVDREGRDDPAAARPKGPKRRTPLGT